jgi:hypothetical protein
MANRQPIDAQSLTEAIQEPNRRSPSPRTFNAAIRTALPPSRNGTDLGSNAGSGGRGGGPLRQRVAPPPSDPSDSSSSDEEPGTRIPESLQRRGKEPRQHEEGEEEDKAEQFFKALYDRLTQPMATDLARKPRMPDMKAPQIFTGKDKTLF